MTTSKQEPKLLEEPKHREMARRIRDHQWETLERIADKTRSTYAGGTRTDATAAENTSPTT